jgi:hypothetical protein
MTNAWRVSKRRRGEIGAVTTTNLALAAAFMAVSAVLFARAKRTTDGKTERTSHAAGALFAVAAVAFLVAAILGLVTGA